MDRGARIYKTAGAVTAGLLTLFVVISPCFSQTLNPQSSAAQTLNPATDDQKQPRAETRDSSAAESSPAPAPSATSQGSTSFVSRARTFTRYAPVRETWTTVDLKTRYVKGVFGGFEQASGIGFGLQFSTADLLKAVEFRLTALTSTKLYRRIEVEAFIPKIVSEKTHADFSFDYLRRTKDNFFGIGPNIPNTSMTNFDVERRSFSASMYHEITGRILAGGYFNLTNSATYKGQRDTDIPINQLFSGDPNTVPVSDWAPGLLQNSNIVSYGGFAQFDSRDNSIGLTKGAYIYGKIGGATGLKDKNAFSDFGWLEGELDARGYVPLGSNKTSLAMRGFTTLRRPNGNSQIPFYDLSFLGGRMYGRGFRDYRFRGNNMLLFSLELRQTVWTQREHRGLDLIAFGDIGQVWGDNRSSFDPAVVANQGFDSRNWKSGIGGGVQYRYSRAFAGRVEIGHSNERNIIYFSVSRGF